MLFEYQWINFLEEANPSESSKAVLGDREGREEEMRGTTYSLVTS